MKVEFPPEEVPILVNQVDGDEQLYHAREIHVVGKENQPKSAGIRSRNQRCGKKATKAESAVKP